MEGIGRGVWCGGAGGGRGEGVSGENVGLTLWLGNGVAGGGDGGSGCCGGAKVRGGSGGGGVTKNRTAAPAVPRVAARLRRAKLWWGWSRCVPVLPPLNIRARRRLPCALRSAYVWPRAGIAMSTFI